MAAQNGRNVPGASSLQRAAISFLLGLQACVEDFADHTLEADAEFIELLFQSSDDALAPSRLALDTPCCEGMSAALGSPTYLTELTLAPPP